MILVNPNTLPIILSPLLPQCQSKSHHSITFTFFHLGSYVTVASFSLQRIPRRSLYKFGISWLKNIINVMFSEIRIWKRIGWKHMQLSFFVDLIMSISFTPSTHIFITPFSHSIDPDVNVLDRSNIMIKKHFVYFSNFEEVSSIEMDERRLSPYIFKPITDPLEEAHSLPGAPYGKIFLQHHWIQNWLQHQVFIQVVVLAQEYVPETYGPHTVCLRLLGHWEVLWQSTQNCWLAINLVKRLGVVLVVDTRADQVTTRYWHFSRNLS